MSDDEQKTMIGKQLWLPPVETADQLPTDAAEEGALCFVRDEERSYVYRDGAWGTAKTEDD